MAPLPKVLCFDVFGTVVDWHGSIVRELASLAPHIDGAEFARAWRAGYAPAMAATMAAGEWRVLDDLHMEILRDVAPRFGLSLTEEQLAHLNRVWHRLTPWPDAVPALRRLKTKFVIAPLSNGGIGLLTNLSKRADLPWDVILSAEVFRAYKPDPRVYTGVGKLFDIPNEQVMLVAAHHSDLDGAKKCGLQTAYIERAAEFGADVPKDVAPRPEHPLHFRDMEALADWFGCDSLERAKL